MITAVGTTIISYDRIAGCVDFGPVGIGSDTRPLRTPEKIPD